MIKSSFISKIKLNYIKLNALLSFVVTASHTLKIISKVEGIEFNDRKRYFQIPFN